MKSIRLILLLLSFSNIGLDAQSNKQRITEHEPKPIGLSSNYSSEQLLEKVVLHFNNVECDSVLLYAEQFIAVHGQEDSLLAVCFEKYISCQRILGNYEKVLSIAPPMLEMLNRIGGTTSAYFTLHREKAMTYILLDSVKQALSHLEICLKYAAQSGEVKQQVNVYSDLAMFYYTKFRETRKALEHMLKALSYSQQLIESSPSNKFVRNHFITLTNVGALYSELGVVDSVLYFYEQSEDLISSYTEVFTAQDYCMFYTNLSLYYTVQEKPESALEAAKKASTYIDEVKDIHTISSSLAALIESHLSLGNYEEAIAAGERLSSYKDQMKDHTQKENYYYTMANLYEANLPDRSIDYLYELVDLKDSLAENTLQSDLKVLETEYEFDLERKALEYQQLLDKRRIKNQRIYIGLVSLLLLMISLVGYISWRSKKQVDQLVVQLKAREEKLSLSNHRLERFVHSISHDMMNKLEYIVLMGNNLVEEQISSTNFQKYYRESRDTAIWLKDYSRGLLDWSEQKIEEKATQTDLQQLVEEILMGYEYELEKSGFNLEVDQQLPDLHMAEPPLKVVLQNLIGNAIKYSKDQPQPKLKIMATSGNGDWTVMIKDNGKGISEAAIETIFSGQQDEAAAHGRGLKIVKDLLTEHEEQIWVDGNDWGGASFFFTVR